MPAGRFAHPWFTPYMSFPKGASLLGHTLSPFNGLLYTVFGHGITLVQAYNLIMVFSFVATGLTTFYLCRYLKCSVAGSLVGGFAFTFGSYHFLHARGHTNLVALEWVPVFIMFWIGFLERPAKGRAALAALALFAVTLCDYYYLLHCLCMLLGLAVEV